MSNPPSGVRIGVDVGGTFTKAVALDMGSREVLAQSIVATTHADRNGVATGVVQALADVAAALDGRTVDLVTHSTTQAVNALLEGDVATVGAIGMGRQPELRRSRKRTQMDRVELSAGNRLPVVSEFIDVSDGLDEGLLSDVIERLRAAGCSAICVAEAFATEEQSNEQHVVAAAVDANLPACASSEMSGLYGLELRAVTAALNASVLPIAVRTAAFVEAGVAETGLDCPLMIMRGDGGATDLDGFRREPVRTLYSGPAASVAGVLRSGSIGDAIVVEVGGTSTNVAAVKAGRPALSYVRVASHVTALRALDVRVIGLAGGSLLRVRKGRLYGVGPRSAHICGLAYSCFADPGELSGAVVELVAARDGEAAEYLALRAPSGRSFGLTVTCAANALGVVESGDYAFAGPEVALQAFAVAGAFLGLRAEEVARRMLDTAGQSACEVIDAVAREHHLTNPEVVAVGGGAGGLGRLAARMLGLRCSIPPNAEVISSIGDALSLVRAERERTVSSPTPADVEALVAEARAEAVAAGASPTDIDVRVEHVAERSALRAVVTGAVGLVSGAGPGREPIDAATAAALLVRAGAADPARRVGAFWIGWAPAGKADRIVLIDRFGDPALTALGEVVMTQEGGDGGGSREVIEATVGRRSKRMGVVTLPPVVWVVRDDRLVEISTGDIAGTACGLADQPGAAAFIIGRSE